MVILLRDGIASSTRAHTDDTRFKIIGRKTGKQRRVEWALGHRHVPSLGDELRKLGISDRMLLDRERLNMLLMDRRLVRIELL